jgi:hypothetical protein
VDGDAQATKLERFSWQSWDMSNKERWNYNQDGDTPNNVDLMGIYLGHVVAREE